MTATSGPLTVSIVMPTLNQAEFLERAVSSVLSQSWSVNELIVTDGGSSDGTVDLLRSLEVLYPDRIRWSSGPDSGPAHAVNKAIAMAQGQIIGWLNSDDTYAPGAIDRAVRHLQAHRGNVMVYGEADHIDAGDHRLGRYPTRPPTVLLQAFADGCFICQPTAFFLKSAFVEVGGLDQKLKTAFDLDLWMKMFERYPGSIGWIEHLQARSRLHAGTITAKFRETVALEGMEVVARYIGLAPAHWLLTHLEELHSSHPHETGPLLIADRLRRLLAEAGKWLAPAALAELGNLLESDGRLSVSSESISVGIYPDRWAPVCFSVRLLQRPIPVRRLVLVCSHRPPAGDSLRIKVVGTEGFDAEFCIHGHGDFELALTIGRSAPGELIIFTLRTEGGFIPSETDANSQDHRALAFKVIECMAYDQ